MLHRLSVDLNNMDNFVKTDISATTFNPSSKPQEMNFTFWIPDGALVSNLSMVTNDQTYFATLKSYAEADAVFEQHKKDNKTAFVLKINFTQHQEILLTATLQGHSLTTFILTYEELLRSDNYEYRQKIKMDSEMFTRNLTALFNLEQNGKKKFSSVSVIGTNRADDGKQTNVTGSKWTLPVKIKPCDVINVTKNGRVIKEFQLTYILKDPEIPSTVVSENYFAYYFMPEVLMAYPKHVIFVVDVSGSMIWENRMTHTKNALITLLGELKDSDDFHIVTFDHEVKTWPDDYPYDNGKVKQNKREAAHKFVGTLQPMGGTNINGGLRVGMQVAKKFRSSSNYTKDTRQFVFFMTDGDPNVEERTQDGILRNVRRHGLDIPVHGFAFGRGANFGLVDHISKGTRGIARK